VDNIAILDSGVAARLDTSAAPTVPTRAHLDEFFSRIDPARARLIFAIDATASRQPTSDIAAKLTARIFDAVAAIGGLDIQLVYFRGANECVASRWLSDARSLSATMSSVMCRAGETQIKKVLAHACKVNQRQKVDALVLISDACEEFPSQLYVQARELSNVPVFLFQEGDDEHVGKIYGEIARVTGGRLRNSTPARRNGWQICLRPSPSSRPAASRPWPLRTAKPRSSCLRRSRSESAPP
jgi:hypothetical protein